MKTATPPRNSRRRPNTSPSRPPSSSRPPKARVKALSTQEREAGPKPRSVSILGSATFTTVASRMNISCAVSTMAMPIAARPALSGRSTGRVAARSGEDNVEVMQRGPVLAEWAEVLLIRRMAPLPPPRYGDCLRLARQLPEVRKMRADAKRNYDRLVEAARAVFREQGYDASLDEVAKRAGVGPGTLYRHFPNRDALLDAIMQSWVDSVGEAVEKTLAFEGPPRDLLLGWFQEYVRLISMHKGGPAKITSAMGDPELPDPHQVPGPSWCARPGHRSAPRAGRAAGRRRDAAGHPARRRRRDGGRPVRARRGRRPPAARSRRRRVGPQPSRGTPSAWTPRTRPRALLRRDGRRRTRPLRCLRPASTAPPARSPPGVRGCGAARRPRRGSAGHGRAGRAAPR